MYRPQYYSKTCKLNNVNRISIGHININSLRNKFDALTEIIKNNIDILMISETKIDDSFPLNQFIIGGYASPFRIDRSSEGGGIIVYVREDIPSKPFSIDRSSEGGGIIVYVREDIPSKPFSIDRSSEGGGIIVYVREDIPSKPFSIDRSSEGGGIIVYVREDIPLKPFSIDRSSEGGGIIVYVREDIPSKRSEDSPFPKEYEGMFIELNLRSNKWLFFGGYNNQKENISCFLKEIREMLNIYTVKYENILLLGDFNSEVGEHEMSEFCQDYNLKNLIKEPTFVSKTRKIQVGLISSSQIKREAFVIQRYNRNWPL